MLRPGGAGARLPAKHQAERPAAGRGSGETPRYNLQSPVPGFPDTDGEEGLPSWKVSGFNRFYHFPQLRPQLRTDYRFPTVPRQGTPPTAQFRCSVPREASPQLGSGEFVRSDWEKPSLWQGGVAASPTSCEAEEAAGALIDKSARLIVPIQPIEMTVAKSTETYPGVW